MKNEVSSIKDEMLRRIQQQNRIFEMRIDASSQARSYVDEVRLHDATTRLRELEANVSLETTRQEFTLLNILRESFHCMKQKRYLGMTGKAQRPKEAV